MDTTGINTKSEELNLLLNFDYNERIPNKFKKITEDSDTKSFSTLAQEIIYECYGDINPETPNISDVNFQPGTERCPGQNKLNYLVGGPILPKPRNPEHHISYNKEKYKPDIDEDEDYWKSDQYKTKEEIKEFYKKHENETENPVPITEFNYLSRESQDRKNCEDTIQKLMLQLRKQELKSKKILETNVKITEKLNTIVICMGKFYRVFKNLLDSQIDLGNTLNEEIKKSYKTAQQYNKPAIRQFINELVQKSKSNEKQLATSSYKVLRYNTMVKICESLQLEVQFCRKAFGHKKLIVPDFDFSIHTKKDWTDKIPLDDDNLRKKLVTYGVTNDVQKLKTYYLNKLEQCANSKAVDEIFSTMLESDKVLKSEHFDQIIDNLVKEGNMNKEEGDTTKMLRSILYGVDSSTYNPFSIFQSVNTPEDIDKLKKDIESGDLPLSKYDDISNQNLRKIIGDVYEWMRVNFKDSLDKKTASLPHNQKEEYDSEEEYSEVSPFLDQPEQQQSEATSVLPKVIQGGAAQSVSSVQSTESQETINSLKRQVQNLKEQLQQYENVYDKSLGIGLDSNYFQNNTIKLKSIFNTDKDSFYEELINSVTSDVEQLSESKKKEIYDRLEQINEQLNFEADTDEFNKLVYEKYKYTQTLRQVNLSESLEKLRESIDRPNQELDTYLYSKQQYRILNYTKNEIFNRYRNVPWKLSVYFEILNIQNRSILLDESLSHHFSFNERNKLAKRMEQSNQKLLEGYILKEEDVIKSRDELFRNPIFYQQLEEAFMDGMNHTLNNIKYDDVINFHDIKNIFNSLNERNYKVDVLDSYQSYIYHPKTMFLPMDGNQKSKQLSIKKLGFSGISDKSPTITPQKTDKPKIVKINESFSKFIVFFKDEIQKCKGIVDTDSEIKSYITEFYNKLNVIHTLVKNNDLNQFSEVYSFIITLTTIYTKYSKGKLNILLKYKLNDQTNRNFKNINWNTEEEFDVDVKDDKYLTFLILQNYFTTLDNVSKKIFIEKLALDEYLEVSTEEEEEEPGTESTTVNKYDKILSGEYSDKIIKDDTEDRLIQLLFGYFIAFIGDDWDIAKHEVLSRLIEKLLLSIYTELTESQIEVLKNQYWNILVKNKISVISMTEESGDLTEEEKVTFFYVNNMDNSVLFSDVKPIEKEEIDGLIILDEAIKLVTTKTADRMAAEKNAEEEGKGKTDDDDFSSWAYQVLEEMAVEDAEAKEKERLAAEAIKQSDDIDKDTNQDIDALDALLNF